MSVGPEYFDLNYFKYVVYNGTPYSRETAGRTFMNWAMSLFQNYNPDNVLDVGCAYGYLVEAMRLGGAWTVGVDWSEHCVKAAVAQGNRFIQQADVRDGLPSFDNGQMQVVTAFNLLDRIPLEDLTKAVKALIRVAQQPILVEVMIAKDDRNPDWSGFTGDLSLVSVYSLAFWQQLFKNNGCVMFEGNFDGSGQKAALLFMKQQTPRQAFEDMSEMRLRQVFLKLGLHEEHQIKTKEAFGNLTREQIIDMVIAKNESLIMAKSRQRPGQLVRVSGKGVAESPPKKKDGTE